MDEFDQTYDSKFNKPMKQANVFIWSRDHRERLSSRVVRDLMAKAGPDAQVFDGEFITGDDRILTVVGPENMDIAMRDPKVGEVLQTVNGFVDDFQK